MDSPEKTAEKIYKAVVQLIFAAESADFTSRLEELNKKFDGELSRQLAFEYVVNSLREELMPFKLLLLNNKTKSATHSVA